MLIQAEQRRRAAAGVATDRRAAVATLHAARKGFAVRRTLAARREADRLRELRARSAASVAMQAMWRRQLAVREVRRAREVAATVPFALLVQACARRWLAKRKVRRWLILRLGLGLG